MITDNLTAEEAAAVKQIKSALANGGTVDFSVVEALLSAIDRLNFNVSAMRKQLVDQANDILQLKRSIMAQDADRRMLESENRSMSDMLRRTELEAKELECKLADLEHTNSIIAAAIEECERRLAPSANQRIRIANLESLRMPNM